MTLFLSEIKKKFSQLLLKLDSSNWWIEVSTNSPKCVYYFGPFENLKQALISQSGYVEDLESEAAQGIVVKIKRCNPDVLTVFDEHQL